MNDNGRIYLDYAATTPLDPSVRAAMLPYLNEMFGNPSSIHQDGQTVRRAIDAARDIVAESIGAEAGEIYFTSGGTEADNTALSGVLLAARQSNGRDHLIVSAIEHHAVLDCATYLRDTFGFRLTVLPVDGYGTVSPESVKTAITEHTALVSIMHANNEIGTIQPIEEIAKIAHENGVLFHTDAVQTYAQLPIDIQRTGIDLLTLSAHKIYGPKGVGALFVRRGIDWKPLFHGGGQEREKRAGTENVAGIVGFAHAVELLHNRRDTDAVRTALLRDRFQKLLVERIPGIVVNGHPERRLANNLNISFPNTDGETLLLNLDMHGVSASSGSACASGSIEPSHVLLAIGASEKTAKSSIRFSLGRQTSDDEIDRSVEIIAASLR